MEVSVRGGTDKHGLAGSEKAYEQYAKETIVGTPDTVVERLQRIAETRADSFVVSLPRIAYDQAPLNDFAREVVPRF